jgi:peptide/nickel transport system ATP-binding protein
MKILKEDKKNTENWIVSLKDVVVDYEMKTTTIRANNKVSFDIEKNKITALVGESGSGKTTVAAAIINCLMNPGRIVEGNILFKDDEKIYDVVELKKDEILKFRWEKVSMVFQGAQSALNPVYTIYKQFRETMKVHNHKLPEEEIRKRSLEVLNYVNLEAERVLNMYPHELSGGMKQRVMIAFALLLNPKLIILDEPTTALDVITQDYIFTLLKKINEELDIAMLLLTHDIGVVAKYADYVGVMYGGEIVEFGDVYNVFGKAFHPYTSGLIKATPSLHIDVDIMKPIPGSPPDLQNLPTGCIFHPRCESVMTCCKKIEPIIKYPIKNHLVKCHLYNKEGDCNE